MEGNRISLDDVIRDSDRPHGIEALKHDLHGMGVTPGSIVLAHVSLSRIGYVIGGAAAVLEALLAALGPDGTLVMPAQSADLTDPAEWRHPAVPPHWIDPIRRQSPPYDAARTPTAGIGVVAELFRTWPGVRRSAHPVCSFAACGPAAEAMLEPHALDDPFGEASPLARLDAAGAMVLLLGAPWSSCTGFHLAERRAWPTASPLANYSPVLQGGKRRLALWLEYPHDTDRFRDLGRQVEAAGHVATGQIGHAKSRYFPLGCAVAEATQALIGPAAS